MTIFITLVVIFNFVSLFLLSEQPIKDAVVTVPPHFNQAERKAVKDAAQIAGLNLLQLMSDNAAGRPFTLIIYLAIFTECIYSLCRYFLLVTCTYTKNTILNLLNAFSYKKDGPVSWGCRIHQLHLCRSVRPPPPNECPRYDTKQSNGEAPVMLELWGMWNTLSLPLLLGPLWPGVVAPDRVK